MGGKPGSLNPATLEGCLLRPFLFVYNSRSSAFQQQQPRSRGSVASQGLLTYCKTPFPAAGVVEMCLTSDASSCSARVSEDAFPLPNRKKKRVSVRCAEKSFPRPAAPCRAQFGTHSYLLCNAYLLQMPWCALFIKYLRKAAPEHTCVRQRRAPTER